MSASTGAVSDQIRAALAVSDPDLDTSVGTTTRKIIDAVSESIAEAYIDQHMLTYTYDVDSKVDADLDNFCQAVGGIARLAAKRAIGVVTFTRADTTAIVSIPVNTQVDSNTDPIIPVQTIAGGTMVIGQSSISVPVQAVNSGPDGNLAAGTLTAIATPTQGIDSVTNLAPLSGGTLQETDDELRARWKATVFRSMAGTEQMYLGTALNDPNVTAAVVVGSSKHRREQIQIVSGVASSSVTDAASVFSTGVFLGGDIDAGALLLKDIDYTWGYGTIPPTITISSGTSTYDTGQVDGGGNPIMATIEGSILELDFEYVPTSSRNDPVNSILNRVDIWVAGQNPTPAQQSVVFKPTLRFTGTSSSIYYTGNYARPDGTNPVSNNVFIPLAFGPIIAVPDVLSIGGSTYSRMGSGAVGVTHANAYSVVHDKTAFGHAFGSRYGLEFDASMLPTTNSVFTVGNDDYIYDSVPKDVQAQIDRWRLAGVDALVHSAHQELLRFNLAIMYVPSANQASVNEAIDVAITTYLSTVGLGGVVQCSDIVQVVHNVAGVDNVRFMEGADFSGWTYSGRNSYATGIQKIVSGAVNTTYINTLGEPTDIVFTDSQVPVLNNTALSVKAQNTFRRA